jgi:hypothetical protein
MLRNSRALLAILVIPLAACAAVTEPSDAPLYVAYQRYRQAVDGGQIVLQRAEYFTPKALNGLDITLDRDIRSLAIDADVVKTVSHYEKGDGSRGCLTVNGYTRENDPISVFIEYRPSDRRWLIDSSFLNISEKKVFNGFFDKALCPDEAQEEILGDVEKQK